MNKGDEKASQILGTWRRLRRNKLALVGMVIIVIVALMAILGPYATPYDPLKQDFKEIRKAMSLKHWFGSDDVGRDIFSRVLVGARITLIISSVAVLMGLFIGTLIGMLGGFYGGKIDVLVV